MSNRILLDIYFLSENGKDRVIIPQSCSSNSLFKHLIFLMEKKKKIFMKIFFLQVGLINKILTD